jgi:hypothetical protein
MIRSGMLKMGCEASICAAQLMCINIPEIQVLREIKSRVKLRNARVDANHIIHHARKKNGVIRIKSKKPLFVIHLQDIVNPLITKTRLHT